jgi:lipopolysaccharide/colanic/teichoic acid biosynthesis glycosyltransferase
VFEQTANACLDLPVRMIEQSALYEDVLGHVPIGQINSAWFQCIMHPRYSPTSPLSKRVLDLAVAAPMAIIALPLVGVLAVLVKLGDGGPAFYRQVRVGEQGREFNILKLRTMRMDAQQLGGTVPKDELITRMGGLLRKTHLDELPQLVNVLRGEMTIVGPRPEQPQLVEDLARVVPYYQRRSLVRPGVTGWAQVRCGYAGSEVGTAWKICHDLYYVKRRSIVFDLLIIIQTLHVLVERSAEDVEVATPSEDFILGGAAGLAGR